MPQRFPAEVRERTEGLTASIWAVGDAYDNAAAETVMVVFKNEAIAKKLTLPH